MTRRAAHVLRRLKKHKMRLSAAVGALALLLALGAAGLALSPHERPAPVALAPTSIGLGEGVAACISSFTGPTCSGVNNVISIAWDETPSNCGVVVTTSDTSSSLEKDSSFTAYLYDLTNGPKFVASQGGKACTDSATFSLPLNSGDTYEVRIYGDQTQNEYDHQDFTGVTCNGPAATCTESFNPSTTGVNQNSTFSWSTANATSFSTDVYGSLPLSGSIQGAHSGQTITVHGTATGPGGTGTCSATLSVTPPNNTSLSGTITATSCTIPAGQGSCGIADSWTAQNTQYTDGNPLTQVNVYQNGTTFGGTPQQGYNWTNTHSNSGSYTFTLPPGTYDMALYGYSGANAIELDDKTATASCAAGTNWDPGSGTCKADQQVPNGGNITGNFESANCSALSGWAFDQNSPSTSIDVQVYTQGGACIGACNYIGTYATTIYRGDVNNAFGISGNHGFSIPLPAALQDGGTHQVDIYGVAADNSGKRSINGDPITISGCLNPNEPPKSPPISYACSADGKSVKLSWTTSAGATAYYPRIENLTASYTQATCPANLSGYASPGTCYTNGYTGTSVTVPITPGNTYYAWVHAGDGPNWVPDGSGEQGINQTPTNTGNFSCQVSAPNGGGNSCGAPAATISATPSRISGSSGQAQISWSGSGVSSSCVVTANGAPLKTDTSSSCAVAPDQLTETVSQQTKYCISCDGATSGAGYQCVLVNIGSQFIHF